MRVIIRFLNLTLRHLLAGVHALKNRISFTSPVRRLKRDGPVGVAVLRSVQRGNIVRYNGRPYRMPTQIPTGKRVTVRADPNKQDILLIMSESGDVLCEASLVLR